MPSIKTKQQSAIKPLLRYIKPYSWMLVVSLIFAAISVALTLYAPILIGYAIDKIIAEGKVDFEGIAPILIKLGIVVAVTSLAQWIMTLCTNKISYLTVRDIRTEAFAKLQKLPLKYIDSHPHGDIISRIITDIEQISDGLLMGFTQLFTGLVTIFGTLGFMLSINVKIALIVVIITPLSLFVARFIAKNTFKLFRMQSEARGEMTSLVEEMVGNQKIVKAFAYETEAEQKFEQTNLHLQKVGVKAVFFSSLTNPCTRFVNGLVYSAVTILGAFSVINGNFSVGQLNCFLTYANQYTKPFNEISGVITELQSAFASARRVFDIIDEPAEPSNKPDAIVMTSVDGTLQAKNVDFSYTPDISLIENLNLDVKSGERIAIVGPTGCGKTTIINLLMRFYDVNKGEIIMSGVPIKDCTRDSMRSMYGMVLQETWLKTGTIAQNIAYANPDATMQEIISAAKSAYCHSFIERLPNGYDTIISDEGGSLSQGQKQLLCIARVMLSLPPMLILDEATSSIDTRTEILIQRTFNKMMQGRTSFIIAHRLSTIQNADCILVMNAGKIIEQGTHDELMKKNGFYTNLYNSQFSVS
ncbi:MAG: ABC transporter ATP-binding protein [Ruminococcus sp.]|nr:ABC transporter ATP-binding protein [Ruminococcus sp.]